MELIDTADEVDPAAIVDQPDKAFFDWAFGAKVTPLAHARRFAKVPATGLDRGRIDFGPPRTAVLVNSGSIADLPARIRRERVAVLAADVAGYSRLVELDDLGAVLQIRTLRRRLIEPSTTLHRARIVRHAGDGTLAAFSDPYQAVACAVRIQRTLWHMERAEPATLRLRLRIGLSIGDVIFDGDDVHGHSVNVAARLEALAEAGGVLMCGALYDAVRRRLCLPVEVLGHCTLKNLTSPVMVHRIRAADLRA